MYSVNYEDDSYYLHKSIEKKKKKILRDAIEDAQNEEAQRYAEEQKENHKLRLKPRLF